MLTLALATPARAQAAPGCPPAGWDRAALESLKAREWAIADDRARNAFALAFTACLAAPEPALRDGLAFEGLQHLLRTRRLTDDTMRALQDDLERRLVAAEGAGFERPFAALVLAEVARADRVTPYLTADRRERLVAAGTAFLRGVRDYRGFDDRDGWRHGVAHGADLLLQLSLNPAFGTADLARLREAIASQVAPSDHAYVFGESERLLAPLLFIARRRAFSADDWSAWFATLASPAPFPSWDGTFASAARLRRRHNLTLFLTQAALTARQSDDTADDVLIAGAEAALAQLP